MVSVRAVNDKLAEVMDGTPTMFSNLKKSRLTLIPIHLDGELVKSVMQKSTYDVSEPSRSSSIVPPLNPVGSDRGQN
jgi:hypothetical protein